MNRRTFATQAGTFLAAAIAAPALRARPTAGNGLAPHTSIHRVEADGVTVFYREAGAADAPVLLHGFPTSSFQYRELIPRLADRYRVIAPGVFKKKLRYLRFLLFNFSFFASTERSISKEGARSIY
jgi:hypothetical protein